MQKRALGEIGVLTVGVGLMVGLVYLEVRAIMSILELGDQSRPPGYQETSREHRAGDQASSYSSASYDFPSRASLANALLVMAGGVAGGVWILASRRRASGGSSPAGLSVGASVEMSPETSFLTRPAPAPILDPSTSLPPDRQSEPVDPEKKSF